MKANVVKNKELFDFLMEEMNTDFKGWDFSRIIDTGRMQEFPVSWDYTKEITPFIKKSESMLDMGTGGGEYLYSLNSRLGSLPKNTCATEGYAPNIIIAQNKLKPLGIDVYGIDDDDHLPIPFENFDLIINRHEAFSYSELDRILKSGGTFITQQIGGKNNYEINELLGAEKMEYYDWDLKKAVKGLEDVGFKIIKQKEEFTTLRFNDIGALAYYLKAIPWQVPDFSIEKYYDKLVKIHNMIQEKGYLDITDHTFLVIAQK